MILISVVIICALKISHFITFKKQTTHHLIHFHMFEEGSAPLIQMKPVTYIPFDFTLQTIKLY